MSKELAPALLEGRYRLTEVLGVGGMSTVYGAYDALLDVWRAVKILERDLSVRQRTRERFLTEARTMARLRHPHIVNVLDVGLDGERVYMVMELMVGGSLMERVDSHGRLTPLQACQAMTEVLLALEHSHQHGVIHRDVKPQNILLSRDGVAKVTDFGIAAVETREQQLTRTGSVMGTWAYMAPEQRKSAKRVDARSDVYSAAATLTSLLTGHEPLDLYVEDTHSEMFADVPEGLTDVLRKATRYQSSERFATVDEFRQALLAAMKDLEPQDGSVPMVPPDRVVQRARPKGLDYEVALTSGEYSRAMIDALPLPTTEEVPPQYAEEVLAEPTDVSQAESTQAPPPRQVKTPPSTTSRPRALWTASHVVRGAGNGVRITRTPAGVLVGGVSPRIHHVRHTGTNIRNWCNVSVSDRERSRAPKGTTPMRMESERGMQEGIGRRARLRPDELFLTLGYGVLAACLALVCFVVGVQAPALDDLTLFAQVVGAVGWGSKAYLLVAFGFLAPWSWFRWRTQRTVVVYFDLLPRVRRMWDNLDVALKTASGAGPHWLGGGPDAVERRVRLVRGAFPGVRMNYPVWRVSGLSPSVIFAPDALWLLQADGAVVRFPWNVVRAGLSASRMNADDFEMDLMTRGGARAKSSLPHILTLETPQESYGLASADRSALVAITAALRGLGAKDTQ